MRRFQRVQNRQNPITGSDFIDHQNSRNIYKKWQESAFFICITRISTINKIGPSDWILIILGSLESSHREKSEFDVSFVISALVKKFFNTQISYNI